MNKVILIGRLTADPELRYTKKNQAYARFNLAVNRDYTKEDGTREADFINVIAWEQKAELTNKYLKKGNRIAIEGRIQTGSYDKEDGSRAYTTDIVVEHVEFIESKPKDNKIELEPEYLEPEETSEEEDPFRSFGNGVQLTDDDLPF